MEGLKFEPLRKRGHSKEGRDNDPQVIIALAVTREGIPVRSWIFPGNTSDVTTVTKIKDDLRGMKLGRTLFVGDAGMYSAANLKELSKGAGRYILAAPVGKIKEIKDEEPSRKRAAQFKARFKRIFSRETGFASLDCLLERLLERMDDLLRVLDRPEIPLHTNGSENGIR